MSARELIATAVGRESFDTIGIAGFTTFARVSEDYEFSSEVPTEYLEDGSSTEDHVILNPLVANIEGSVSNLYTKLSTDATIEQRVNNSLGEVGLFSIPQTQSQAQRASRIANEVQQAFDLADQIIGTGDSSIASYFNRSGAGDSIVEQFIDTMERIHLSKSLVDIDLPNRRYRNMRIISLRIRRNNQDDRIDFSLRAQQVRFSEQQFSDISELLNNPGAGLNGQAQGQSDRGTQEGEDVPRSVLFSVIGGG